MRDAIEWIGESSSPYGTDFCPRKGRIPGAKWIEWYRMMKPTAEGPRFKSVPEILAECATAGIGPYMPRLPLLFQGGSRRPHLFGAERSRGSRTCGCIPALWNEWSRDPSLPIEEGYPARKGMRRKRLAVHMLAVMPLAPASAGLEA